MELPFDNGDTMIRLIAGLGNPGPDYAATRHNAGFWFIDAAARQLKATLVPERSYFGLAARVNRPDGPVWLLEPMTFDLAHIEPVTIWTIAQVQLKNWEPAMKGLEAILQENWQRRLGSMKALAMVEAARAEVALGKTAEARRRYQAFFEFWKNADPDVPLLIQAREEFSRLR